jgi:two-component system NtrC family sensor kinase
MPLSKVRWWNRLSFRLTAVLAAGTLAVVGTSSYLCLRLYQRHLVTGAVRGAAMASDAVMQALYHNMLAESHGRAYRSMEEISQYSAIEQVRIFDKTGRVVFSTHGAETGSVIDMKAEACHKCHAVDRPIAHLSRDERYRIYQAGEHRVLGLITPVYNRPTCSQAACHVHPAEKRVLGVIDVGISLSETDADVSKVRRQSAVTAGAAILLIAALVVIVTHRAVVRPVGHLVRATRQMGAGDFTLGVPVTSRGELGALEHAFNEMSTILGTSRAERQALLETLEQQVDDRTTALRMAQAQLVQTEKLSSLGRLAASVAHEINNPLAGILTYAKLIVRHLEVGDITDDTRATCVRNLKLVQRETERCSAIVRSLLEFSRQRPLALGDVDAVAVLDEAISLLSHQAKLQGVALERRVGALPHLKADAGQLRQAFVNIILNACEAMPSGGRLRVSASATHDGTATEFGFTDSGCGIPPDKLPKVFDPFFTTKEMGTGLGLSVVYGIVERHGGTISLSSDVGHGTTFTIRLPVSERDDQPTPALS